MFAGFGCVCVKYFPASSSTYFERPGRMRCTGGGAAVVCMHFKHPNGGYPTTVVSVLSRAAITFGPAIVEQLLLLVLSRAAISSASVASRLPSC